MQFSHLLIVAGACLVLFGSIGPAPQMLRRLKRIWSKPLRQTLPLEKSGILFIEFKAG